MRRVLKYLALVVIAFAIVTSVVYTLSIAYTSDERNEALDKIKQGYWTPGENFPVAYAELESRNDLFCIQHNAEMRGENIYVLNRHFRIEGNQVSDDSGNTVNSYLNGMIAYIASQNEGYGAVGDYTQSQKALYAIINRWFSDVGSQYGFDLSSEGNSYYETSDEGLNDVYYKAKEEAERVGNITNAGIAQDETNKQGLKISVHQANNGTSYTQVGPFKWRYSGQINSITLVGDNGITISSNDELRITKYLGNEESTISASDITSGSNFYLSFRTNLGINTIKSVTGYGSNYVTSILNADLWFLESSDKQNLMLVSSGSQDISADIQINVNDINLPVRKDLTIIKVDEDDTSKKLPNVEFILYHKESGKYIKEQNGSYIYVDNRNSATTFKTNSQGEIKLNGIANGTYIAYETKNPNYGYEVLDKGITIPSDKKEYVISNHLQTKDLTVVKVDKDNHNIVLKNVGFKFYNNSLKKYLAVKNGEYVYVDTIEQATEFKTDKNGKINLKGILIGEYIAYETKNPNTYYGLIEEGIVIKNDQTQCVIENEKIYKDLKVIKVDEDNHEIRLQGVKFVFYNNDLKKYIGPSKNGDWTWVDSRDDAQEFTTNANGELTVKKMLKGSYTAYETENPNKYYGIKEEGTVIKKDDTSVTITNKIIYKDLKVIKVDEDNQEIKLPNVEFVFYNNELKKYVGPQKNGDWTWVDNRNNAQVFKTDENGELKVERLLIAEYTAYEVENPNYGYAIPEKGYTVKKDDTQVTFTNKQLYVSLSGYVWEDIQSEKQSIRNDLYKHSDADDKDIKVQGVTVRLKDKRTGAIVKDQQTGKDQTAQTDKNGEYLFKYVLIDELSNYYVEFTYDGLIYQSVEPHIDRDNGSKAAEPGRQAFNNKFASVEVGSRENQAAVKDSAGNVQATVEYNFTQETNGRTASITKTNNCDIIADTNTAGYTIKYTRGTKEKEVKNINLGIYKRRQADLALQNELDQVKVEIEGYGHIYKYGSGFNTNDPNETQKSWNLGVRFENPYKNVYKRPIYRADAEYDNDDKSKELKVALTYKMTLANQETLTAKVNRIVDYFDARYTIKGVGTGVSEQDGTITNPLQYNVSSYNDKYNKVDIYANTLLEESAQNTTADKVTQKAIYIQFDLSRENILNMLNEASIYGNDENKLEQAGKNLKNTAEITSFTTYSDKAGKTLYAAVDKDSIPGNATVDEYTTYEDDTDKASTLAIVIANAREISGTVFEDLEDETLSETKNISQGDATYDASKENAIGGVKVQLVEVDSNGNVTDNVAKIFDEQAVNADGTLGAWTDANAEAVSDSNGGYAISGFIPGKYAIKYVWGDGSYKIVNGQKGDEYDSMVENYKATVIDYDKSQSESKNNKFYRDANESEVRTSHAMDNISTRKEVDNALKNYNYEAKTDITEMTSQTPVMEFNIEYDDNDLMSIDLNRLENRVAFKIKNMDFGIIRRPEQDVNFVKTLSEIRLTLANGQVLIDAKIDENGNLVGQTNHATYMPPRKENGVTVDNGYLKIEMDEDLIQGSTVQMKFKLTTENTSQADYIDDSYGYYQYGESYYQKAVGEDKKDTDVITLTPSKIVDYLDPKSVYRPEDPTNIEYAWRQISIEELKNEKLVASNITDALESGEYDTGEKDGNGDSIIGELDESQIFTTDYLDDAKLKPIYTKGDTLNPAEGGDVYMVVDKVLSSSEDADFQNQAELVLLGKPGGGKFTPTPGNYLPNRVQKESDDSTSQEVTIVPSTGGNRNYIIPVVIGMVALAILGTGIVVIKKTILGSKNKDE